LDADSDLDMMLVKGFGTTDWFYYNNQGTASSPLFPSSTTDPFNLTSDASYISASVTFGDVDEDGDQDAFVFSQGGNFIFFENYGTASTRQLKDPLLLQHLSLPNRKLSFVRLAPVPQRPGKEIAPQSLPSLTEPQNHIVCNITQTLHLPCCSPLSL
jgi:hypothetical protein